MITTHTNIHVGTSGWTYDDWQGAFYPGDVKGADRLAYYAAHFDALEVNASFYRVPTPSMIAAWNQRLPPEFHLVLKGSRLITHRKRLRDCDDAIEFFFERALQIDALKLVLWQLPPQLHADPELLDAFLDRLPRDTRHAVEFRHESWWSVEVCRVLQDRRAAFVAISHPDLPPDISPTTDFLYVRFHGRGPHLYDYDYSRRELGTWVRRLRPLLEQRELYAFFNNDGRARAPHDATTFRALLDAALSQDR